MSTFTKPVMKNALALLIQAKNDAQRKLVVDVPAMINSLSIIVENGIGNESTQDICRSFGEGYIKYGRLTEKQLSTLKNIILQYASEILAGKPDDIEKDESEHTSDDEEEAPF